MVAGLAGFIIGTVLGSFSKALADRSLNNKSFWGRSYCPRCKHKLAWYDLFPVLSYLSVQGKCRYCKTRIGIEYVIVETMVGVLIAFLFWQSFNNFQYSILNFQLTSNIIQFSIFTLSLITKSFFITILSILFITDLKKMFIPDRIILPSIIIGIFLSLSIALSKVGYLYYLLSQTTVGRLLLPPHSDYFQRNALLILQPFLLALLMAVIIGGFFLSLIIITKGKGMGGGDVKLGAFMGIMLGFPASLFALALSFITGAIFSIALVITGKKHFGQAIPFGPFLVLGSLIMIFWASRIINWYLGFLIR